MVKDIISAVVYHIIVLLFIHLPVLNQEEFNSIVLTKIFMVIISVIPGMKKMIFFINSYKMGCEQISFQINQNILQESWKLVLKIWGESIRKKLTKYPALDFCPNMVVSSSLIFIWRSYIQLMINTFAL